MKIAHICPTACMPLFLREKETYHLVLVSQVLASPMYASFYARARLRGDFVILDNDAYEVGKSCDLNMLIDAAQRINPSMVVLPDDLTADGLTTTRLALDGLDSLMAVFPPTIQYMAVPHGRNPRDYINCARKLATYADAADKITCIGIYKNLSKDLGIQRTSIVRELNAFPIAIHLLGLTNNLAEIQIPFMRQRVLGMDTCRFVQQGLRSIHELPWIPPAQYDGRAPGYFGIPIPERHDSAIDVTFSNIAVWRDACS